VKKTKATRRKYKTKRKETNGRKHQLTVGWVDMTTGYIDGWTHDSVLLR
jgi:hypothetical protein